MIYSAKKLQLNFTLISLALELTHSDFSTSDDWVRLGVVLGETLPVHQSTASPQRENPVNFTQRLKKYRKM